MRILFLTTQIGGHGGVQYAGRLFVRAMGDAFPGCRQTIVSILDSSGPLDAGRGECEIRGAAGSRFRAARLAIGELRRPGWDLVVLAHANLAPVLLVHRPALAPITGWVYGVEAWRPLGPARRRGMQRLDHVLYISEHTQTAAARANPWLERLARAVCPLALGPEASCAAIDVPPFLGERFALAIGRMASGERYKGHEEMIRIWPQLESRLPDTPLVVIGGGDDRPRLEQLARGLKASVRFLGPVDDALRDACLARCRAFCLPSRGEGFGLVYLEAMRHGRAVLAGDCDAGREVVVDGVTGRTVDARSESELLDGLAEVLGFSGERMGCAGQERYRQLFSYPAFVERLAAHYTGLLAGRIHTPEVRLQVN